MSSKNLEEIVTSIFKMQYTIEFKLQNLKSLIMLDDDKLKELKKIFSNVDNNKLMSIKEELNLEISFKLMSLKDDEIKIFIHHYEDRIKAIKSSFKNVLNSRNLGKCYDVTQKILKDIITETDDIKSKLKVNFVYFCVINFR